jgi:hypothetical protein
VRQDIFEFFECNIESLEGCDGGGLQFSLPKFELMPKDFLRFAEYELNGELDSRRLINAISNLKRAMDSELDILMSVLNLDEFYRQKRLGVEKKFGFLRKSGIFNATSLDRLNKLRNKLEHHYEIPKIEDVHIYYDLVSAFISISDSFLYKIRSMSEVSLSYINSGFKDAARTSICLDRPKVGITLFRGDNEHCYSVDLSNDVSVDKLIDFAYLLKINLLISDFYHCSVSKSELVTVLKNEI